MSRQFELTICFIGAGYVGGPTAAVMAKKCPNYKYLVVDNWQKRIDAWNSEDLPIYEPQLQEVVEEVRGKNLFFHSRVAEGIKEADIIMVAVNTPNKTGSQVGAGYDLSAYESVARIIAAEANGNKIVVEKSTVPVRTAEKMRRIFDSNKAKPDYNLEVISNPEFLAEGTAIRDLSDPSRVLIGGLETLEGKKAVDTLAEVYSRWVAPERIITTNVWSAELGKLASNAFLAQRVSSINSMSALCEASGANVNELSKVLGSDPRIGPGFLNASVGFGGSCLEKDLLGLIYICESYHLPEVAEYWRQVLKINNYQKTRFATNIISKMFDNVKGKAIAIYGFAFKKNTGDTRLSPAIDVCRFLLKEGAVLYIYDPKVPELEIDREFIDLFPDMEKRKNFVHIEKNPYSAAQETHAVVVLTEWDEFKNYDYERVYKDMQKPAFVFDGRNILDHQKLSSQGFQVVSIGRQDH